MREGRAGYYCTYRSINFFSLEIGNSLSPDGSRSQGKIHSALISTQSHFHHQRDASTSTIKWALFFFFFSKLFIPSVLAQKVGSIDTRGIHPFRRRRWSIRISLIWCIFRYHDDSTEDFVPGRRKMRDQPAPLSPSPGNPLLTRVRSSTGSSRLNQ